MRGARAAAHPCATFNKAWQLACAGDVVALDGGTYADPSIKTNTHCGKEAGAPVTFRPARGARVTIKGELDLGANTDQSTGAPPASLTINGAHRVTIEGGIESWFHGAYTRNITIENLHVWHTSARYDGDLFGVLSDNLVIRHVEIGPICCSSSGIDLARPSAANRDLRNVAIDHVYMHDVRRDCAGLSPKYRPGCGATNNGNHIDGLHIWGANGLSILNSRWLNLSGQVLFLEGVNDGQFNDVLIKNNMLASTGGDPLIIVTSSDHVYGPSYPLINGYMRIVHNTLAGQLDFEGGALPSDQWAGPNAQVTIAGNIGKLDMPCAQETGKWTWENNMWSQDRCPGDSAKGTPRFVDGSAPTYNLHLVRGSPGLGRGPVETQGDVDLDGHLRPIGVRSDAGASQRETAAVRPARSIGAVKLGEKETNVLAFYGAPKRTFMARVAPGIRLRESRYPIHGSWLNVFYANNATVAGVSTGSRYYRGKAVVPIGTILTDIPAPKARSCRSMERSHVYYSLAPGTQLRVAALAVFRSRFAPRCSTRGR